MAAAALKIDVMACGHFINARNRQRFQAGGMEMLCVALGAESIASPSRRIIGRIFLINRHRRRFAISPAF